MSQVLQGMAGVVRSPLGVIVVALISVVVFALVIILFAPINEIAKYVFAGIGLGLFLLIWLQFWSKAKGEPLAATETYYREELMYQHMGTDRMTVSKEELRLQTSREKSYVFESLDVPDEEMES